jgi:FkbM family methyltransferase
MRIKDVIRDAFIFFHMDVTKNLKYDRLTKKIIKEQLKSDDTCVDIGCHTGDILRLMLKSAPAGTHFAFEPLPHLYAELKKNFGQNVAIFPYALADNNGDSPFQFVKNAPAYSGIKKRRYDIAHPDIEEIHVELKRLDDVIQSSQKIDFIKIDVEGAELAVLKGARNLLLKYKPMILFECGKGASDFYDTQPADVYGYLCDDIGLNIYTLQAFVDQKKNLSAADFERLFETNTEYYFIAVP